MDYEEFLEEKVVDYKLGKKYMEENFSVWKSVLFRFLRGAVAGAVSAMVMLNLNGISTFADLKTLGTSLVISGTVGAISGGLLALDKFFRA